MSEHEPNTQTLANKLAGRLHADIVNSGLQEDEFFMTGDQVEAHYGVSRSIAREALSQLRALGVLKSRQRKGLLVGRPDPVALMAQWVPLYCQGTKREDLIRLAQLRYALELGAVDLSVSTASPDQIDELGDRAERFKAIAEKHGHNEDADTADLAYHRLILEMTGNPLIAGMHRVLSDYFVASTHVEPHESEDPHRAIREHHMIVEAFVRRDTELVRSLLRAHLEGTVQP
ncbi:MAG: FadR family transcriptional regulator [bacterium]|nr:FadR family transcriptional regulator [bacterium]